MNNSTSIENISIPLDRDIFMRKLIRELAGILEEVVGYEETAGYISLVGQNVGEWINEGYKKELGVETLSQDQVVETFIDLKKHIKGDFYLIEQDEDKVVLGNRACPFGDKVLDRPSMCMMTSNVFGVIAAENLGYAKVVIKESIANRCAGCKVIVYLKHTPEAESATGREYFGSSKESAR